MQTTIGQMMRVEDVAEYLQLDVRQVQRLVDAGTLPSPRKIGARSVRWIRAEIDAAIAAAPTDEPLVGVRFVASFGPYNAGEQAGFVPSDVATLLGAGVAELADLNDWPRVRPHAISLAKQRHHDDEKRLWRERGLALAERAKQLAASDQDDSGGDEPEADGDGDEPTGPGDIPPDVQGLREDAIRRAREREPITN